MRRSRSLPLLLAVAASLAVSSLALADLRESVKVLRVGVLGGDNVTYRAASLEPFRAYLEARLGLPVEIVPAVSYHALIEAQASGRTPYAIHSVASYATVADGCHCVEPIAAPLAGDGALGFYSILVVRAESPIRELADARGARLALAGDDSVAGRLVPLKAFSREGIAPSKFFARVVDTPDPEAAIASLLAGDADIATGWSSLTGDAARGYDFGVLSRMVSEGKLDMSRIRIIWQSSLIPFGPHVLRSDAPPELKTLLSDALTGMAGANPEALDAVDRLAFGGGGFTTPAPGLYAAIEELVAHPPASAE
jgi:phosphonate transport system substrate-binding protein